MTDDPLADPPPDLEELVARALELLDVQGPEAVEELLRQWPAHAAEVERVLRHAHGSGLVGNAPGGIVPAAFPERLGDFRLVRRLGAGGMGDVFEAELESLRRRVAVKVIRADLLFVAGARERFAREVEAVTRLQHPGIVLVLAVGEHAGVPFFAMELVRGCTDAVLAILIGQQPERLAGRAWRDAALALLADFPSTRLFSHLHAALCLDQAQLLRPDEPGAAVGVAAAALSELLALDRDSTAAADRGTQALLPAIVTTLHAWHVEDGRFEAAVEVAKALAEAALPWADPYTAAQLLVATAVAARTAGHAALAENWLDGALAGLLALDQRGWPTGRSVAGEEFAPLRARPEFTALLARLR